MGYGGNLIWTTVFKALNERTRRKIAPVHMPLASDLAAGFFYDRSVDLSGDSIFRGNPRLAFGSVQPKNAAARLLDRTFARILSALRLRERYEHWVLRRAADNDDGRGPLLVHVDMRVHSYAARQERRRTFWKGHARAADAMLEFLGGGTASEDCELHFAPSEAAAADAVLVQAGIDAPFLAFEPETNRDFFGDLRAWPRENWQGAIAKLALAHPQLKFVQIGAPGPTPPIAGSIDLRGKTDFRMACLILKRARLFIGTEGGLMHAANAVGARAVILWGGITLPEFIGYPKRQRTLCQYVACAPCGNSGWCDKGHICMRTIGIGAVCAAANEMLAVP